MQTDSINRRSLIGGFVALAALGKLAPAFAQAASTPEAQAEGDADALEVLRAASTALLELETFQFSMETTAGQSSFMPGMELEAVEGSIRRPTDLAATVRVKALFQSITASAVSVDGSFWVQNPLDQQWMELGQASEAAAMINPDWILQAAITLIKDARITSTRNDQTLIEGYVNLYETLSGFMGEGGEADQIKQFLAEVPVDVAFWINSDNLIERTELYGPIFAAESPDVEKRIDFFGFNEPVEIEKPAAL